MPNNALLKKPKKAAQAPKAPKPPVQIKSPAGGTQAPASAARGPGISNNRQAPPVPRLGQAVNTEKKPAGPATVQQPGNAPTPYQAPARTGPPPTSMSTQQKREAAWANYNIDSADIKHKLYLAALAYGDPNIIKLYGDPVDTANGALQIAAREALEGKKTNALSHNANNTFFSGMNLDDVTKISNSESAAKQKAWENWEASQGDLTHAMQQSEQIRQEILDEANREDLEAFEATEPEPQGGTGGGGEAPSGGGGAPNVSNPGGQKASAFSKTGLSQNKPAPKNEGPSISQNESLKKKKK